MAVNKSSPLKLTKRTVDSLSVPSGDAVFWDRDLPGFGIRVYSSGRKVWCVQVRKPSGKLKREGLGPLGKLTPDGARKKAAEIIDRLKRGLPAEPVTEVLEPTVSELAERYIENHVRVNCKRNTVLSYVRTIKQHILPRLGNVRLSELDRSHVSDLHGSLRDRPAQANLSVRVLSGMLRAAEKWGLVEPGRNPCRTVRRYREEPRERFLTPEEYIKLGAVLAEAESEGSIYPSSVAAIRLLMLTGCRKQEVLSLRWDDIDRSAGKIRVRDGKTGSRQVPLTPAVEVVLDSVQSNHSTSRSNGNPWVIPGKAGGKGGLKGLDRIWRDLRERAGLSDVRIHDLRHSYASMGLALGEGLPFIGKLLGHRKVKTTARYAHLMLDAEKASAARIGTSLGSFLLQEKAPCEAGEVKSGDMSDSEVAVASDPKACQEYPRTPDSEA